MTRLRTIGFAVLAPVIAVLIAMLATSLVIVSTGSQSGVGDFWRIILTKPEDRILVNIVNQTTMIYLSAVAAALGFRMGLFNIGVEGQYTLASYTAATFAGAAFLPGALNVFATLVIAMAVGAAWAGIAGILRTTRGVSEVISTIMLNAIAGIIVGYLLNRYGIHGGNSVRTTALPGSSHVPGWTPFTAQDGPVWGMALLAIAVGIGFWMLLNKTRFGFDLRATGQSQTAAVASGIKVNRMVLVSMLLSGAVAGLIWMPAFFGAAYTYGTTFQAGLGFTGIAVALLGRNNPIGIFLGALIFSFLAEQGNVLNILAGVSPDIVAVTQGIILLAVVIAYEVVRRYRVAIEQSTVAEQVAAARPEEAQT
jgi:ABC-type uncharacterized transport system permease subunit